MTDASALSKPAHLDNPFFGVVATGESIGQYTCVSFTTSGTLRAAVGNNVATLPALGLCLTTGTSTAGAFILVLTEGIVTNSAWSWTPGGAMFLDATGALTQTVPTAALSGIQYLGQARSATSLYLRPWSSFVKRQ